MAKKKKLNTLGLVFAALVIVGLILAVVGVFLPIVSSSKQSIGLSHDIWETLGKTQSALDKIKVDVDAPSRTFTIIAFVITLVGAAVVAADAIIKALTGKNIKFLGLIASAVTVIGAVLILVAGLTLKGQFNEYLPTDVFSAAAGIWLGFIGGLVAGIVGLISSLLGSKK